jgi:hypothetical protein
MIHSARLNGSFCGFAPAAAAMEREQLNVNERGPKPTGNGSGAASLLAHVA